MTCRDTYHRLGFKCQYQDTNARYVKTFSNFTSQCLSNGARVNVIHASAAGEIAYIEQVKTESSEEEISINAVNSSSSSPF